MNIIHKLVARSVLPRFLISIAAAIVFMIPCGAHASYGWVMGSYKTISSANSMILKPGFAEVGAVIVRTMAGNYKRRIIAGCFSTEAEAWAQRSRFVAVRKNQGIWLLKTDLGCKNTSDSIRPKTDGQAILQKKSSVSDVIGFPGVVTNASSFKPKRWRFKGGDKIAYTDGTHPSIFFLPPSDDNGNCLVVKTVRTNDFESIVPPQEERQYSFRDSSGSKICKAIYIYKVSK